MAKMTTVKKIELLCAPETFFSIGDGKFKASDLTVEQAEKVSAQYPNMYVNVIEEKVKVAETESQQA